VTNLEPTKKASENNSHVSGHDDDDDDDVVAMGIRACRSCTSPVLSAGTVGYGLDCHSVPLLISQGQEMQPYLHYEVGLRRNGRSSDSYGCH
jgi:hypothetical protein